MGMFGGNPLFNMNQRYGGGFDPVTGAMSLSGGVAPQFSMPSAATMPTPPSAPPAPTAKPGFFGAGGAGRSIAGYIGDALLSASGHDPVYAPMIAQARQQSLEGQRQLTLAQYKAQNPEPSDIMREAQSMGLKPGSPQWNDFIQNWRMKQPMIILGNPANGQQVVDPSQLRANTPPPPTVGEVQDGHVYMGGDPSLPTSWRAQ